MNLSSNKGIELTVWEQLVIINEALTILLAHSKKRITKF